MQLTRWTHINKEFDPGSRFSKKDWCELIETFAVPGKIIAGIPYIDGARFASATSLETPSQAGHVSAMDLLS